MNRWTKPLTVLALMAVAAPGTSCSEARNPFELPPIAPRMDLVPTPCVDGPASGEHDAGGLEFWALGPGPGPVQVKVVYDGKTLLDPGGNVIDLTVEDIENLEKFLREPDLVAPTWEQIEAWRVFIENREDPPEATDESTLEENCAAQPPSVDLPLGDCQTDVWWDRNPFLVGNCSTGYPCDGTPPTARLFIYPFEYGAFSEIKVGDRYNGDCVVAVMARHSGPPPIVVGSRDPVATEVRARQDERVRAIEYYEGENRCRIDLPGYQHGSEHESCNLWTKNYPSHNGGWCAVDWPDPAYERCYRVWGAPHDCDLNLLTCELPGRGGHVRRGTSAPPGISIL